MSDVGIFIGEEHIGSFTPYTVDVPEKHGFEFEYYMRRGNKIFLRNNYGYKLQFSTSELSQDLKDLKYGTKLICQVTIE